MITYSHVHCSGFVYADSTGAEPESEPEPSDSDSDSEIDFDLNVDVMALGRIILNGT